MTRINLLPAYKKARERAYQKAYWAAHPGLMAKYSRKYRAANKEKRDAHVNKVKQAQKDKVAAIKLARGCEAPGCGFRLSASALHFHHLRDKEFTIASAHRTWKRVEAEITKCIVLCANCHARVHAGELALAPQ